MIIVVIVKLALPLSIVYRCTPDVRVDVCQRAVATRLQIQHVSVLWTGVEQPLFGRKIAVVAVVVVVVTAVVVVVFRLAKDRAGAVDGGELGVVGSVGTVGALDTAVWAATSAEYAAGETARSVLQLAATTVSGMFSVAFRTDGHTAPHGPVAPEAGQAQGQASQQAPPRGSLVR